MTERRNIRARKCKLGEEPEHDPWTIALTHGQRIEMVWEITTNIWSIKEPSVGESRLRRDVARVIRRGR